MDDLNRKIQLARNALNATNPNDASGRAYQWDYLCYLLGLRFLNLGAMSDLTESINFGRLAISATSPNDPKRIVYLNNLASGLADRYSRLGNVADLDEAIDVAQNIVNTSLAEDPFRAAYLNNLGARLDDRFQLTGSRDDLTMAIHFMREAFESAAENNPHKETFMNNLAVALGARYKILAEVTDLEEAIEIAEKVVDRTASNHPERPRRLNNLANRLGNRYTRTKALADLNEAIRLAREAISSCPKNHPDHPGFSVNLAILLGDQYHRSGTKASLDEAIQAGKEVLEKTAEDDPKRSERLNNHAIRVRDRYLRTGKLSDLEETLKLLRKAIDSTAEDHPDRATWLFNLSVPLANRYQQTENISDLEKAISVVKQAVATLPEDHLDRSAFLNNLGDRLGDRYWKTGDEADLKDVITSFQSALRQSNSNVLDRIFGAQKVLRYHAQTSGWQEAYEDAEIALNLVPRLTSRSLQNSDKQAVLGTIVGLARDAAASALNAGKAPSVALKLLEQGRGALATSLDEIRTDIIRLRATHPELANEFTCLRDILDKPITLGMFSSSEHNQTPAQGSASRRYTAGNDFDQLIIRIRELSGFQDFLLPPSEEETRAAACRGPIAVINVSTYRCDALLVEKDSIRSVALPELTIEQIGLMAQNNRRGKPKALAWLWNSVTKPVLDALGISQPPSGNTWPQVWWIPTGQLTELPLHAAGIYDTSTQETVFDRVMSSYGSSIKSIIQGRQSRAMDAIAIKEAQALLVSMTHTPGTSGTLKHAAEEVAVVQSICKSRDCTVVVAQSRKPDVLLHLQNSKIFHFAGHGSTHPVDPSRSSLLLEDCEKDPLVVANLLEMNLRERSPFLAYLSACGTGRVGDEKFFDESIHLISAFQLSGFRHAIGTLWEVNDDSCLKMAKITYEEIMNQGMTDKSVCLGLHKATRALRDRWLQEKEMNEQGAVNVRDDEFANFLWRGVSAMLRKFKIREVDEEQGEDLPWVPYVHFGV